MPPPNTNTNTTTEETPLLGNNGLTKSASNSRFSFRRVVPAASIRTATGTGAPSSKTSTLESLRVWDDADMDFDHQYREVHPADGLSPLVTGGIITTMDGHQTHPRPASEVKSLPAFAPFRRRDRHRSFYLWWINEFRHWWKSRYDLTVFVIAFLHVVVFILT